jgi:hypothetical protein
MRNKIIKFYSIWFAFYLLLELLLANVLLNLVVKYILYLIIIVFEYKNSEQKYNIINRSVFFMIILTSISLILYIYNWGFDIRDIAIYNIFTIMATTGIYLITLFLVQLLKKYKNTIKYAILFCLIINPIVLSYLFLEIPYLNIIFDSSGTKHLLRMFDYSGKANSQYIEWDEQGNILVKGYYKHGYKEGIWEEYDSNGTLINTENYDTVQNKVLHKRN